MILVALAAMLGFDRAFFGTLDRQADKQVEVSAADHAQWLLVPIVLAILAFFLAKYLGHRRLGVVIALVILMANHVAVSITRIQTTRRAEFERRVASLMLRLQIASTIGGLVAYAGIGVYLLR